MKQNNKRIGIPGYLIGENTFGVAIDYLEFITKYGVPVIITPQDVNNIPDIDLLLCPGGPDILPNKYGHIPSYRINKPSPMLEHFDDNILPQYMERKTPILAVCRGMQFLWTKFGGKLIQHYPYHPQSRVSDDQCHELIFTKGFEAMDSLVDKVTSRHHQVCSARDKDGIPKDLLIIAYSGDKKKNEYDPDVVEIFKHKSYPMYGVQYHPESHDLSDKLTPMFMDTLLNANFKTVTTEK